MVHEITTCGLVIAHTAEPSAITAEFAALCEWPLLTQPSIRMLVEQIELSRPLCLAFWLDATSELTSAAKLIEQLRARGPRPFRIAIAHNLPAEVEHKFRAAGVHTYLTTSGNILALVEGALLPFIEPQRAPTLSRPTTTHDSHVPIRGPTEPRASPANLHPP
jgi:hypothetical protein